MSLRTTWATQTLLKERKKDGETKEKRERTNHST